MPLVPYDVGETPAVYPSHTLWLTCLDCSLWLLVRDSTGQYGEHTAWEEKGYKMLGRLAAISHRLASAALLGLLGLLGPPPSRS